MTYTAQLAKMNEKIQAEVDRQVKAMVAMFVKNLAAEKFEARKYTQKELREKMFGEAAETPSKDDESETPEEEATENETDLPEGLTPSAWEKIQEAHANLEDGQKINVKSRKPIKKVSKEYVVNGAFCGPSELEEVVNWCAEQLPSEEVEPAEDEEESPEEDDGVDGFTAKDLDLLKKALKNPKNKGQHVSAHTRKQIGQTDKNKKVYVFDKKGYCVKKDCSALIAHLKKQIK